MNHIILASSSPRRRELVKKLNRPFKSVTSHYQEDMTLKLPPAELVQTLALGKAAEVQSRYPENIIIGADTVVNFQGQILGKPHTNERAVEMLKKLAGQSVDILTGVAILAPDQQTLLSATGRVKLKQLTDGQIDDYVATGEPLDKAGAFAVQGIGKRLIEKIEGDYEAIVGLPIEIIEQTLSAWEQQSR